jgi:hypothetical protein
MVVLCSNPRCGAVLRIGMKPTLLDVVLSADGLGPFFVCPRCQSRSPVRERRRAPRPPPSARTASSGPAPGAD